MVLRFIAPLLLLAAVPASAALDFNAGNFGTYAIGPVTLYFTPSGGSGNYSMAYAPGATSIPGFRVITSPELPSWVGTSTTGGLVGVATTSGPKSTTIRCTDTSTGAFVDKAVSFTISSVDLIGGSPWYYAAGDPVSQKYWPAGGVPPYTYTLGGTLPPGLSLVTQTINGVQVAVVSGTITAAANTATTATSNSYGFNIKIQDSTGDNYTRYYGMAVTAMQLSVNGSPVNSGSGRFLPNGVVGQFYSQQITATGGTPPYTFALRSGYSLPTGISLSSDGLLSGTPTFTTYGFGFNIDVTDSASHILNMRLALAVLPSTPVPLGLSTGTLSGVAVGDNSTLTIYASGGLPPYTFSVDPATPLPSGAVLVSGPELDPQWWDPQPVYIRTAVRTAGNYSFTLKVTDSAGNQASRPYTLSVSGLSVLVNNTLPNATLGVPYTQYIIPIGGTPPYAIAASGLPAGLTVDNAGKVSGTPQEGGRGVPNCCWFSFPFDLSDSTGDHSARTEYLQILSSPGTDGLFLTGGDIGPTQLGQTSLTLSVSGAPPNPGVFTATLLSGSLPPGMAFLTLPNFNPGTGTTAAAQVAGICTTPGTYTFTYKVTDSLGNFGIRQVRWRFSALSIVNQTLPPGTVGMPYSQPALDVRGGVPPYTFTLPSGNLPTGLSLNPNTGAITGTPQTSNSTSITIRVTDSTGDYLNRGFTLNIYPIQLLGPDVLPTAIFGQNYSYTFQVSPPGSYTFTSNFVGSLGGLTLNSSGTLAGTVSTTALSTSITVTAYNNVTNAVVTRNFTLFFTSQSNQPFLSGLPTSYLGDFTLGSNVATTLSVSGGTPPYTIALAPGSFMPPGLSLVPATAYFGASNFGRWLIAGVPTTAGTYSFTLRYTDSAGVTQIRLLSMNVTRIGLAVTGLPNAIVNQPYSFQLTGVGGGPYLFAVADLQNNVLPPGLTISPAGLISGVPTSTGSFGTNIALSAGGSSRNVFISLTVGINSLGSRVDFSFGPVLPEQSMGKYFSLGYSLSGGAAPYAVSVLSGALPPGIQMSISSGTFWLVFLSGAPASAGKFRILIRVDDSTGLYGLREATLVVSPIRPAPANLVYSNSMLLPPGGVGQPYSFAMSAYNARAPLNFVTETGTRLPAGMTLNGTGVLSGTPTEAGNFVLFWKIVDADGNARRSSAGLTIYPGTLDISTLTSASLTSATVGTAYSFSLNDLVLPGYGTPPVSWTLASGSLPPGIVIVPAAGGGSAKLSGTPTTVGTYFFGLLATDANGRQSLVSSAYILVGTLGLSPLPGALPTAVAGVAYQTTFTASGGMPPYTFSVLSGSDMPVGLSLSPSGVLSGTPSTAGPFLLYAWVFDANGVSFSQRYTLNVLPAGSTLPAFKLTPASINISHTIGDPDPAPIPISVGSVSTPLAYTAAADQASSSWLSVSPGSGTTPGAPNVRVTPGSLATGTYSGNVTFTSPGASNSPATIPVNLTVVNAVVCTYQISPDTGTMQASGGGVSFNVAAPAACTWSVDTASLPAWIHVTPPALGSGNGKVDFTVDANPDIVPRSAAIAVNGIPYTLKQFGTQCSFSLQPATINLPSNGGAGPIAVVASNKSCSWTSIQVDPWIRLKNPPPANGSGTGSGSVDLLFDANPSSQTRTGSITIAGQTLAVTEAGLNCNYALNSAGASISSTGGSATFNITAPAGCAWTADTGPGWILPASSISGTGNGKVDLTIAANSTINDRKADVLVGGQRFTVQQAGVPCSFSLSANNPVQPAGGGGGSIDITTNAGCPWTAVSTAQWLTPAANSGIGPINLGFTVDSNGTGKARSATLTIVGQKITVNQSGPVCSYSLQSTSATVPGAGGGGGVGVLTVAGCGPWTASSNAPSWLHITGPTTFSGPATPAYSVDPNLTGLERLGTLDIAGQPFPVTQPAAACTVTVPTIPLNAGEFGGLGQFTFTVAPAGCNVPIQSYSSWLTVTSQLPLGTVTFTVAANTYAAARSGTIAVGDKTYTVNQAPSTCAYTLTSFAKTFDRLGGNGGVPMTFAPAQCGAPPVLVNGPPGMVTLTPSSPGAGTFTQNYSVDIYQSFINYVRTTQLVVNGQIYTVKQTSW